MYCLFTVVPADGPEWGAANKWRQHVLWWPYCICCPAAVGVFSLHQAKRAVWEGVRGGEISPGAGSMLADQGTMCSMFLHFRIIGLDCTIGLCCSCSPVSYYSKVYAQYLVNHGCIANVFAISCKFNLRDCITL